MNKVLKPCAPRVILFPIANDLYLLYICGAAQPATPPPLHRILARRFRLVRVEQIRGDDVRTDTTGANIECPGDSSVDYIQPALCSV
jgi:hypothetical protein